MNLQILLNKNKSKKSINKNNSLTTQLKGSKRILPCDPFNTTVSQIDVYNSEREACNKIRLTLEINPICSNVLFNNVTEVVKNEGSDEVIWLNYDKSTKGFTDVKFRQQTSLVSDSGNMHNVFIKDTQLSNDKNNFVYHCGLDIFNNHYLRSKTFKTICKLKSGTSDYFNTIFDNLRTYDGEQKKGYDDRYGADRNGSINLHVYLNEEIESFKESVSNKLIEKNGWFGFTNVGKLAVYNDNKKEDKYDWFKVINNKKPCDFIDMYPERDLFYFDPKYNSSRNRIEKNWNYCITYPSSSTTDINFIHQKTNGLKIMFFDDNERSKNGIEAIKIWSVSKHGLKQNDIINLYKNDKRVIINSRVIEVENDYTFLIYKNGEALSNEWIEITPQENIFNINNKRKLKISSDKKFLTEDGTNNIFYIINYKRCNIDVESQDLSFKRVVNNEEVSYYVRIFSKLPNWKFCDVKPTTKLLYGKEKKQSSDVESKGKKLIQKYQSTKYDFENHIGKLAFSKNIYNDNICEIVFTDDIVFSELKDNLGRPLSELYLTIIKNNAGYREWYGKSMDVNIKSDIVEFSHCFGKISCAFKLSDESTPNKNYNSITLINNINKENDKNGLNINKINNRNNINFIEQDEIQYMNYKDYDGDKHFYGDLCCYSNSLCEESSIQMVNFRFNTAQRELTSVNYTSYDKIKDLYYDEIASDDYDEKGFISKEYKIEDAIQRKEGYYYIPHYKIPIKSYDNDLTTVTPRFLSVKTIELNDKNGYTLTLTNNHLLGVGSIINIYYRKPIFEKENEFSNYNVDENKSITVNYKKPLSYEEYYYYGKVVKTYDGNTKMIDIEIYSDSDKNLEKNINITLTNENKKYFIWFIKPENVPDNAYFMKDGSCRFLYRKLYQNGFYNESNIESYPFTNNALYVNKSFNFYLRRQNPDGTNELKSKNYPYDIFTNTLSFETENKYYNENEIKC